MSKCQQQPNRFIGALHLYADHGIRFVLLAKVCCTSFVCVCRCFFSIRDRKKKEVTERKMRTNCVSFASYLSYGWNALKTPGGGRTFHLHKVERSAAHHVHPRETARCYY